MQISAAITEWASRLPDGRPVALICLRLDTALVIGYQILNKYYSLSSPD